MKDEVIQEWFRTSSRNTSVLALRVTALEKILLDNKIITEEDLVKISKELNEDFKKQTQKALEEAKAKASEKE